MSGSLPSASLPPSSLVPPSLPPSPGLPYPPTRRAAWALGVLIVAYILSFVDRSVLALLVEPIKADLQVTDVQISLLQGAAFALFYTFLGIPIARLADRSDRRRVIATGVALWSVMTTLCGMARSFGGLFAARVGVGVGEAALSPAAYSMLADYFPPARLTPALSLYTAAAYVGGGLALIAGGAVLALAPPQLPLVGSVAPWKAVFLILGVPGLLVALLVLTIEEPPRRTAPDDGDAAPSFGRVIRHARSRLGAYGWLTAAVVAHSMMWNGVIGWFPTFLIREHGLRVTQVGAGAGMALLFGGTAGIVLGGAISARLRKAGRADANHLVFFGAALAGAPFGIAALTVADSGLAIGLYAAFVFFAASPYGGIAAVYQEITPNRMRAQISACYQFALNLAGIGFGPTLVALLGNHLWSGRGALPQALGTVMGLGCLLAAVFVWLGRAPYRRTLGETLRAGSTMSPSST